MRKLGRCYNQFKEYTNNRNIYESGIFKWICKWKLNMPSSTVWKWSQLTLYKTGLWSALKIFFKLMDKNNQIIKVVELREGNWKGSVRFYERGGQELEIEYIWIKSECTGGEDWAEMKWLSFLKIHDCWKWRLGFTPW